MTEQSLQALARANSVRLNGARIRREMNAMPAIESRLRAAELLRDPPSCIARMEIGRFLRGIRGIDKIRSGQMLAAAGVYGSSERRIGPVEHPSLTARQREELARVLEAM